MTANEQVGKKLRILRNKEGLSQVQFGKLFGMTQNMVTNVETGKRILNYDELIKIADYYGVTTDYIIRETE